jgi:hypothetical protein
MLNFREIRLGTRDPFRDRSDVVPTSGWNSFRLRRLPPAGSTLRGDEKQLINASTVGALNALTSDLSPIVVVPYRGRVLYHRGCSDARIRFRHLTCPLCLVIVLVLVVVLVLEWRRAAKEVAGQTSFTFFAQIRAVHTGGG